MWGPICALSKEVRTVFERAVLSNDNFTCLAPLPEVFIGANNVDQLTLGRTTPWGRSKESHGRSFLPAPPDK